MIKLYARDNAGARHYHEAWVDDATIVEHWGRVGERGATRHHDLPAGGDSRTALDAVLADARTAGFTELDGGDVRYLDVVYELDLFAPSAYLDVCDRTRDLLNSALGWTGLGHWDSSRIESSVLRVRSAVVDVQIAERIIRAVLEADPPGFAIEADPPEARTPPEQIRVAYEDYSSRTDALGRYADGQFLALITGTGRNRPGMIAVALLLFDHVGTLVRTDIRDVPLSDADAVRDQLIQGLADVAYGDIAIRTFSVEADGVTWCLVDQTDEYGEPRVSLYPLDILFYHPWDGTYDT